MPGNISPMSGKTKDKPEKAPNPSKRERYPMPDEILNALKNSKLFDAYEARPLYQRDDWLICSTSFDAAIDT